MTFAHPNQLYWGLLAIPLIILAYTRRAAVRRVPVAADWIWAEVLAQDRVRSAWLRWRRNASLAVQLAILAALVFALADPLGQAPQRIVVVLDNSTNRAADEAATARISETKETVRRWVADLRDCDRMAVVSSGSPAMVHCAMTGERQTLNAALESVQPVDSPAQPEFAADLAKRLLGDAAAGRVILVGGAKEVDFPPPSPPLWPWLVGVAAVLAVFEWCLYQRRWLA
jgi:hypothetical protein